MERIVKRMSIEQIEEAKKLYATSRYTLRRIGKIVGGFSPVTIGKYVNDDKHYKKLLADREKYKNTPKEDRRKILKEKSAIYAKRWYEEMKKDQKKYAEYKKRRKEYMKKYFGKFTTKSRVEGNGNRLTSTEVKRSAKNPNQKNKKNVGRVNRKSTRKSN